MDILKNLIPEIFGILCILIGFWMGRKTRTNEPMVTMDIVKKAPYIDDGSSPYADALMEPRNPEKRIETIR